MAAELKINIEKERRAEKMKNELITNISHDLRTPLTSIMGYLQLICEKKYKNMEQLTEYANITYDKSKKLKILIEDLFEYTQLINEKPSLTIEAINLNDLLQQLLEELVPLCQENNVSFKYHTSKEKIIVAIDSQKIVRVFDNILMNAIKYSYKPGEIKVRIDEDIRYVTVTVYNKGDTIPEENLTKLFQRFYREVNSNLTLEGSGLGLAIAKSIVEQHDGKIWAECNGNNIYFKVKLSKAFRNSEKITSHFRG